MLKVKLSRNLRRDLLRGAPWVYRDALVEGKPSQEAELCKVLDQKGKFLCWAIYDPHSVLALRVLSLSIDPPKNWAATLQKAYDLRKMTIDFSSTNSYRLFNGEGDLLPGLVCDIYDRMAVLQFDGQGMSEFWNRELVASWLMEKLDVQSVFDKSRMNSNREMQLVKGSSKPISSLITSTTHIECVIKENHAQYLVNLSQGQKTGFFLDQRDNRNYIRSVAQGLKLLNLFSYTGGFSVAAGLGGASEVSSVDISAGAIELANHNWQLNQLPIKNHRGICTDVFEFLDQNSTTWDMIIVDPPSMAHSEQQREKAITKYTELFARAAKSVTPGGHLVLSSCSSHISFADFEVIISDALSKARRRGQILKSSGQGPDHPYPHSCQHLRYLKFVHICLSR